MWKCGWWCKRHFVLCLMIDIWVLCCGILVFGVLDLGFWVLGFGFGGKGLGFGFWVLGLGLGFWVWEFGFGFWGLGFRV